MELPGERPYVLDTSAVFALLENEEGASRVEEILKNESVVLPFVVAMEVFNITVQESGEEAGYLRQAMLKALPVTHATEIDEPTLLAAGRFKANHEISLADALIAAVAFRYEAVLLHKDPEYELLADEVRQEMLPYKARSR